jgi:hypothetical protein
MPVRLIVVVVSAMLWLSSAPLLIAQKRSSAANTSSLCTTDNALYAATQQILGTRTFDNLVQRIAVLLRAADLLWPHQEDKARAAFMEAFDLAGQNFKETGDESRRVSQRQFAARIQMLDQRYKVIAALAKRDPAAARKLSDKMLQDEAREAAEKPAADIDANRRTAEKLLTLAAGLVETDVVSAINFARNSLRYQATLQLPIFFYELSKANRLMAEQFYEEALAAYGSAPMDQFLYLSAYPFGNNREAGEMPAHMFYRIPDGFAPNRRLQRLFTQKLLARIQVALEKPVEAAPDILYSDPSQMWLALSRLEKQIQTNLPDLSNEALQSRNRLFALLTPASQRSVNRVVGSDNQPKKSFDEQVEAAEKLSDVGRRDQGLTFAVTGSSKDEAVEKVVVVIDKISDPDIRGPLLNWFYFFRAQAMIADKKLNEARKLVARVTELDQRAYLFSRIAEESLKETGDQTQAREMLNEIADAVAKAPKTIVSARALLGLAYLYAKIDVNRGIEELGNAVRTINSLESPDFSLQFVMMKIEGKTFGSYAGFSTPGFNPENAFREMGKLDFDGSLSQATTFTDKSLRALTTLAVIEPCLQQTPKAKPRKANHRGSKERS